MSREIPGHWIDRLFCRMDTLYGSAFVAMWRDVDVDEMKSTWRQGLALANVTDEGLKRGVAALFYAKKPPNLPEFIELCMPPSAQRQNALALTNEVNRTPPEQAREQLAKIREAAESVTRPVEHGSGIAWAHRLIGRAERGEHVSAHQLTCAKTAIEQWQITHGTMRHEREPGSDDE